MQENINNEVVEETTPVGEAELVTTEEVAEEVNNKAIADEENPLNEQSSKNLSQLLTNLQGMVQIMESQWMASARELDLKDIHMRQLAAVNDKYKENPPEHLTEEQRNEWDYLNGIDKITDEDIHAIFPEGHKIYGVDHSQTVDRIKGACQDFYAWVSIMREYRNVHDAYIKLIELEEEKQIEELKVLAEKEIDEEKKAAMQESIDMYYNRKYLKWLSEPVDDFTKHRIVKILSDESKASYVINRCRDKLKQLKISSKFILELSQFEKRYLDEKYQKCSNVLLSYFMNTAVYNMEASDKKDDGRVKIVCMVMALDAIVRNTLDEEKKQMILDNITAFEDQFIDIVPEAKNIEDKIKAEVPEEPKKESPLDISFDGPKEDNDAE